MRVLGFENMRKKIFWFIAAIFISNAIVIGMRLFGRTWLIGVNGLAQACYYLFEKKSTDSTS